MAATAPGGAWSGWGREPTNDALQADRTEVQQLRTVLIDSMKHTGAKWSVIEGRRSKVEGRRSKRSESNRIESNRIDFVVDVRVVLRQAPSSRSANALDGNASNERPAVAERSAAVEAFAYAQAASAVVQ